MITFRHMHPLAPLPIDLCRASARCLRRVAATAGLLLFAPAATHAQTVLTHTEDAAPVPKGMLRFRVTTGWSRFDERFTPAGRRTLGDEISATDFGVQQLPLLAPVQAGLRILTDDAGTKLSLGHLAAYSDARTVTTPIVLEYGLTRRLTVGIMVPVVQTRRSMSVSINKDSTANVGFVPVRLRGAAATQNAAVFAAYRAAADSLAILVSRCPTNPLATGCAAVNLDAADASAAGVLARQFADAVKAALGTDTVHALIAPRKDGALAARIEVERAIIDARVQKYLGASAGASAGVFTQSSNFSYIDLQGRNGTPGLLQSALGGGLDSLQTTNKLVLGGLSVGAQFLVFDHFLADTMSAPRFQSRLSVGAGVRYESLPTDSARTLGVISAAEGSAIEVKSAMDVMSGILGGTIAAHYTQFLARAVNAPIAGDPEAFWPYPVFGATQRTAGSILSLDVTPRLLLGDSFAVDAHYGLERMGAPTYAPGSVIALHGLSSTPVLAVSSRNAQRVGFGFRYSTVDTWLRGRVTRPIEVSFTHLQTISGTDGVARIARDQVQVRLFFRVRQPR